MRINELKLKIYELIDGGEWAISFGQCGTLSYICLQLADVVEDRLLADKARHIAVELERDLLAMRHWGELAQALRHHAALGGAAAG